MAERSGPDWEVIEAAYRAGLLSIRAIADQHGVSDTAIRKHAAKQGWTRDLTDKVRQAAKDKLVRGEVRSDGSQADEQIIERESEKVCDILLTHRASLQKWAAIADRLCDALAGVAIDAENHGDIARSLNAGVDAQLKVIKGQRQAYSLDEVSSEETIEERLARLVGDSQ